MSIIEGGLVPHYYFGKIQPKYISGSDSFITTNGKRIDQRLYTPVDRYKFGAFSFDGQGALEFLVAGYDLTRVVGELVDDQLRKERMTPESFVSINSMNPTEFVKVYDQNKYNIKVKPLSRKELDKARKHFADFAYQAKKTGLAPVVVEYPPLDDQQIDTARTNVSQNLIRQIDED